MVLGYVKEESFWIEYFRGKGVLHFRSRIDSTSFAIVLFELAGALCAEVGSTQRRMQRLL